MDLFTLTHEGIEEYIIVGTLIAQYAALGYVAYRSIRDEEKNRKNKEDEDKAEDHLKR